MQISGLVHSACMATVTTSSKSNKPNAFRYRLVARIAAGNDKIKLAIDPSITRRVMKAYMEDFAATYIERKSVLLN